MKKFTRHCEKVASRADATKIQLRLNRLTFQFGRGDQKMNSELQLFLVNISFLQIASSIILSQFEGGSLLRLLFLKDY